MYKVNWVLVIFLVLVFVVSVAIGACIGLAFNGTSSEIATVLSVLIFGLGFIAGRFIAHIDGDSGE
ncbi:hypothetical protein [Trueperella sp. LYQ141]|uniref:hypothetical protein n=1 Tax=Trueperella sp. LYQ141 TaxID=3391058 RepID=UPI0039832BD7